MAAVGLHRVLAVGNAAQEGKADIKDRDAEDEFEILGFLGVAVLGLAFLLFGYFIYFKKKYNLINGFEADFQDGRKNEAYAKRVGLVEFVVGIALLIAGVALILFA